MPRQCDEGRATFKNGILSIPAVDIFDLKKSYFTTYLVEMKLINTTPYQFTLVDSHKVEVSSCINRTFYGMATLRLNNLVLDIEGALFLIKMQADESMIFTISDLFSN